MKERTREQLEPDWPTCQYNDAPCAGIRFSPFDRCLAHLQPDERAEILTSIGPGADIDARGTSFSQVLLGQLLDAVRDESGHLKFTRARFNKARFESVVSFDSAEFEGLASFVEAWFERDAWFRRAHFKGALEGAGLFSGAKFEGDVSFHKARFEGEKWIQGSQFDEACFLRRASFHMARFKGEAGFRGARFMETQELGPLAAHKLNLDGSVFSHPVLVEAAAVRVSCTQAKFEAGATFRLRYANLDLEGTTFAAPSTVTTASQPWMAVELGTYDMPEPLIPDTLIEPDSAEIDSASRVISLRGVDVTNLVITDVRLASCKFAGAHHLDQLRIEGSSRFADTPRGPRVGWAWPPVWWWTRRQVLAEEHAWRSLQRKSSGWHDDSSNSYGYKRAYRPAVDVGPERLAALYRALRKGLEDSKNEPGAADFYYGECEMRRHAAITPWAERGILWLYWLVAGYGLRGLRALACLAALIVAVTVALQQVGFPPGRAVPSLVTLLVFTAQSVVSLETRLAALGKDFTLTSAGDALRLLVRVLGPVLLGLALLSIRNRIKR